MVKVDSGLPALFSQVVVIHVKLVELVGFMAVNFGM